MKKGIEMPISVIASLVIIVIVIIAVIFFFLTGLGKSTANINTLQNVSIGNISEKLSQLG